MGSLRDLMKAVSDVVASCLRWVRALAPDKARGGGRPPTSTPTSARERARSSRADPGASPGESGPEATVEVDPHRIGSVRTSYSPRTDGAPDPGEIVWTWVPFEENDGRGKDRPVLVVAAEPGGTYLAVPLTSGHHDGDPDFVPVGAGAWDGEHRPSWANLDRVIRVHAGGVRRAAATLPRETFEQVTDRLHQRYGWR